VGLTKNDVFLFVFGLVSQYAGYSNLNDAIRQANTREEVIRIISNDISDSLYGQYSDWSELQNDMRLRQLTDSINVEVKRKVQQQVRTYRDQERERHWAQAKTQKESIISKAESLYYVSDTREANKKMKALFEEWKQAPRSSKEDEDLLWLRFQSARQRLQEKTKKEIAKRDAEWAKGKAVRERICAKAEDIARSDDLRVATDKMKQLDAEWKSAPKAKKEDADILWGRFKAAKDKLYERKKSQQKQREADMNSAKSRKEAIISRARSAAASSDIKAAGDTFQALQAEWKTSGNAGKEANDRLWDEFRSIKQQFYNRRNAEYERKKAEREQKNREWQRNMQQRITRLEESIRNIEQSIIRTRDTLSAEHNKPDPSWNNPHRMEIASRRLAKKSSLNSKLRSLELKRADMQRSLSDMKSKLNSSYR